MKLGLVALATLAFATTATAATTAENPLAQQQAVLTLKGLDLSTAEGQQRLAIRMDNAARAVCGDRVASIHLDLAAQAADCHAAVLADVRNQIEARMALASGSTRKLAAR